MHTVQHILPQRGPPYGWVSPSGHGSSLKDGAPGLSGMRGACTIKLAHTWQTSTLAASPTWSWSNLDFEVVHSINAMPFASRSDFARRQIQQLSVLSSLIFCSFPLIVSDKLCPDGIRLRFNRRRLRAAILAAPLHLSNAPNATKYLRNCVGVQK